MTGRSREVVIELQLEPREALVVDADVSEDLRTDGSLRVRAPFLREKAEPGDVAAGEHGGLRSVRLSRDVDEPSRAVCELPVEPVGIETQRAAGGDGDTARVADLHRVRVHGHRLLTQREPDARAVEDRPPRGRQDDLLAVLRLPEP